MSRTKRKFVEGYIMKKLVAITLMGMLSLGIFAPAAHAVVPITPLKDFNAIVTTGPVIPVNPNDLFSNGGPLPPIPTKEIFSIVTTGPVAPVN